MPALSIYFLFIPISSASAMGAKISFFFYTLVFLMMGTEANAFVSYFHKLFVFGDSYADTGNLGKLDRSLTRCWYEPYGTTFPGRPAGRFSDGKVLPDFIASFLGIRSPVPYKLRKRVPPSLLQDGMNFAVAGTGVFDLGNFQRNLSAQIGTFEAQISGGVYSKHDLDSSVALVLISGNDYAHFFETRRRERKDIWDYIQNVTALIKIELERIQNLGVKKVVATNLSPLGCTPLIASRNNYTKCDTIEESVVEPHNKNLNEVVKQLSRESNSSRSKFLVLDLHSAFTSIINQGDDYILTLKRTNFPSFAEKGAWKFEYTFRPCCEGTSPNLNCGQVDDNGVKQYSVCRNPGDYLYWDSVHPSQAGWNAVFQEIKPWLERNLRRN